MKTRTGRTLTINPRVLRARISTALKLLDSDGVRELILEKQKWALAHRNTAELDACYALKRGVKALRESVTTFEVVMETVAKPGEVA